jgi:hypothetical protein
MPVYQAIGNQAHYFWFGWAFAAHFLSSARDIFVVNFYLDS